jgi:tryptophanyl-tRNA synthetase
VPGLDARKMSKSYGNAVDIYETSDSLAKKVMSMYTDPAKVKRDDPGHPEPCPENPPGCVVFALHKLYGGAEFVARRDGECRGGKVGCVACKKDLLAELEPSFAEFRRAREKSAADPRLVDAVLEDGARKARAVARATMADVRRAMRLA